MSASEIIQELSRLTETDRRAVLEKLHELVVQDEGLRACELAAQQQVAPDRMEEAPVYYHTVDLLARNIGSGQAADLRARLRTFAEDWERPEASVYDQDPAR